MRCLSPHINPLATRALQSLSYLALCIVLTGTCVAGITESANEVLHRIYADHYAGRAIALKTLTLEGEISAFGLSGSYTGHFKAPNEQNLQFDFGIIKFSRWFDGSNGYSVGRNGNTLELSGFELAGMVNSTYLVFRAFLDEGDRGGEKEYLGPLNFDGRGCHHFRFFPPGGSRVEVVIDSINGTVLRSSSTLDDVTEETTHSDFRDVNGIAIPFRTQTVASVSELPIIGIVTRCLVNVESEYKRFTVNSSSGESGFSYPPGSDELIIPLEYTDGHLFVEVHINKNGPYRFMLDSGAGTNFVATHVLESLGIEFSGEIPARGLVGYQTTGLARLINLEVGGVIFTNRTVSTFEFPPDMLEDGVLGFDFLIELPITVDLKASQLTLHRPSSLDDNPPEGSTLTLPLEYLSGAPMVEASVNGTMGKFMLDLGSSSAIVFHNYFAVQTGLDTLAEPISAIRLAGIVGSAEVSSVKVKEIRLGELILRDYQALVLGEAQGVAASREIAGNFGLGFWQNYLLTLDYPARRILLAPLD